jgi:predicted AlkP superfamily pyrophosphatase or phosphodiesterase
VGDIMKKKLALYTFIDAFGWEIYQENSWFLKDIIKDKRRLETTFGFSSGADPSILTGRYPQDHTHWSSFFYSPKSSPFKFMKYLAFLPRSIFDRGRIRHWISVLLKKFYRYTGYFEIYSVPFKYLPYFDYLEKYDYFVPRGILKTDTIFDWCVDNKISYHCSNWRLSEEENIEIAKNHIKDGEVEFIYLYLPKLDGVMHTHGTKAEVVQDKLKWLEENIKDVYDLANEHYDEVSLYVFGDHGMTNTKGSIDLISQIESLGFEFGKDYVAMYDSTMARFWFLKDGVRDKFENLLSKVDDGEIVIDEKLKEMKVFFDDYRFGELIFLMNAGVLINPSFMGLKAIPGMHGFDTKDKDSYSAIISTQTISDDINSITDIRKTMQQEISG